MAKVRLVFPLFLAGILLTILLFGLYDASFTDLTPSIATNNLASQTSVVSPVTVVVDDEDSGLPGQPVIVPHYSAMIASLRPTEAISAWTWLINEGTFSPLNNVESLLFPTGSNCNADEAQWNQLKGSWNLALQTLGWGRFLTEREGEIPILWEATVSNTFLRNGYLLLVPEGIN